MSLSNGPFDKGQTISGACAKADELVFKVNGAALWVEQSPLRFRPSKLARVLHDGAQFFQDPILAYAQDFASETIGTGSVSVHGFGPDLDTSAITKISPGTANPNPTLTPSPTLGGTPFNAVWFGDTCAMKYDAGRPIYPIVPSNNLVRGYRWHKSAFRLPEDPNLTAQQPSNYPTVTMTVTPSATAIP